MEPSVNARKIDQAPIQNELGQLEPGDCWTSPTGIEFVYIPSGNFTMGSDCLSDAPCHKVTITKPFFIGKYPVVQKEWIEIMGSNPSSIKGDCQPVNNVSWDVCTEFTRNLSRIGEKANHFYRLPTEAEWEYVCRAGSKDDYCYGNDVKSLDNYAWFRKNAEDRTHPVGQLKPNRWGVHDMHGNVWEWCSDPYHAYAMSIQLDPQGGKQGNRRVNRGGCWASHADRCASAFRIYDDSDIGAPYIGLRLVMEI